MVKKIIVLLALVACAGHAYGQMNPDRYKRQDNAEVSGIFYITDYQWTWLDEVLLIKDKFSISIGIFKGDKCVHSIEVGVAKRLVFYRSCNLRQKWYAKGWDAKKVDEVVQFTWMDPFKGKL